MVRDWGGVGSYFIYLFFLYLMQKLFKLLFDKTPRQAPTYKFSSTKAHSSDDRMFCPSTMKLRVAPHVRPRFVLTLL